MPEPKRKNYLVSVERDSGFLVARNDEICIVTQGRTMNELELNIIDAIETALETDGNDKSKEFSVTIKKLF